MMIILFVMALLLWPRLGRRNGRGGSGCWCRSHEQPVNLGEILLRQRADGLLELQQAQQQVIARVVEIAARLHHARLGVEHIGNGARAGVVTRARGALGGLRGCQ